MSYKLLCTDCWGGHVEPARAALGYRTCMHCGEQRAKARTHTIVPVAKSNYIVVSDLELLKGLNKYANT